MQFKRTGFFGSFFAAALAAVGFFAICAGGCATYSDDTKNLRAHWNLGDTEVAEREAAARSEKNSDGGDALVWLLEEGAAARANGDFKRSVDAFDRAFEKIRGFESEPEYRLCEEASAVLANRSFVPYKGYNYDKIMLCVYQSMNYMELGRLDRARVELKRLANFQAEAKRENSARIEARANAMKEAKAKNAAAKTSAGLANVGSVKSGLSRVYGAGYAERAQALQQAADIYANPFGYWLGGVFFANAPRSQSDRDTAEAMFRICAEMLGGKSAVVNSDYAAARKFAGGAAESMGDFTYIVFETGVAPARRQFRLDLPLYLISRDLPSVHANFPYLRKNDSFKASLEIQSYPNAGFDVIADMDSIIQNEFDINLPYVITTTIAGSAAKAAAQYFAARAAGDYSILVNIGGSVLQGLVNDADLRTWTTLPKQIKLAKIPTPSDGRLVIAGAVVNVNPKGTNIVFAKRMSAEGKTILRPFSFGATLTTKNTKD